MADSDASLDQTPARASVMASVHTAVPPRRCRSKFNARMDSCVATGGAAMGNGGVGGRGAAAAGSVLWSPLRALRDGVNSAVLDAAPLGGVFGAARAAAVSPPAWKPI